MENINLKIMLLIEKENLINNRNKNIKHKVKKTKKDVTNMMITINQNEEFQLKKH